MPAQLTAEEVNDRRVAGKQWLGTLKVRKQFRDSVGTILDKFKKWDNQVASNHFCRQLRIEMDDTKGSAYDEDRAEDQLQRIFAILAMQNDHEIPPSFRQWPCPPYWKETLSDIDNLLNARTLLSKRLDRITLATAKVVPAHILKAAHDDATKYHSGKIWRLETDLEKRNHWIKGLQAEISQRNYNDSRVQELALELGKEHEARVAAEKAREASEAELAQWKTSHENIRAQRDHFGELLDEVSFTEDQIDTLKYEKETLQHLCRDLREDLREQGVGQGRGKNEMALRVQELRAENRRLKEEIKILKNEDRSDQHENEDRSDQHENEDRSDQHENEDRSDQN